ncbi:MAG: hypothetical protein IKU60_04000, partial [Clostridia bacterium]|nr:hypothetical protein [Clostridia bacterium]
SSEEPSSEEPSSEEPSSEEPSSEEPSSEEPSSEEPSSEEPSSEEPSSEEPSSEEPSSEEPSSEEPSSEEPSDEPSSEEPSDEPVELPFEAVDVVVEPSALGVAISGKFVAEDVAYETVVVVISYLKDGKAYCVQAVEVPVIDGEVQIPSSSVTLTEGELTVAGISLLVGVNALEAITTGNLGTPVGSYK